MARSNWDCRIDRVYLWACLVSLASCLVGMAALASPSWTQGDYGDYDYLETGLLLFCHQKHDTTKQVVCAPLTFGARNAWFEAARLMTLTSWIFVFTVFVLSILLHFQDDNHEYSLPLVILGFLSGILGFAAAIVYVVPWTSATILDHYDVTLSWGYAVDVIWHLVTIILFTLLSVASRGIWVRQYMLRKRRF